MNKKEIKIDHWKSFDKGPEAELDREHIDYLHSLFKKKLQDNKKNQIKEEVPTNSISGGGIAMFSPLMKFKEFIRQKKKIKSENS